MALGSAFLGRPVSCGSRHGLPKFMGKAELLFHTQPQGWGGLWEVTRTLQLGLVTPFMAVVGLPYLPQDTRQWACLHISRPRSGPQMLSLFLGCWSPGESRSQVCRRSPGQMHLKAVSCSICCLPGSQGKLQVCTFEKHRTGALNAVVRLNLNCVLVALGAFFDFWRWRRGISLLLLFIQQVTAAHLLFR